MENLAKMELPAFLMLNHISRGKNEGEYVSVRARINPVHITSYVETFNMEDKKMVAIFVAGQTYIVDMTIEEVDAMMENIDRGVSIRE